MKSFSLLFFIVIFSLTFAFLKKDITNCEIITSDVNVEEYIVVLKAAASTETSSYDWTGSEGIVNPDSKHHLFSLNPPFAFLKKNFTLQGSNFNFL